MRKKILVKKAVTIVATILLVFVAATSAVSCGGQESASDKIGVAVTLVPYADFVRQVGGDKVDVTIMVPVGASPHTYEPTTSQMRALSEAEAYVQVGSGVEIELTWMDNLIAQNTDMLIIDCSTGIDVIGTDPHVWTSPANAKTIVENICDGLVSADPDNAAYYQANRDGYLGELDDLDEYVQGKLAGYPVRYFLIYHPAFAYFAHDYDLHQLAIEHEGKAPTPQLIQQCIDLAQQYNLNYVYVNPAAATQYAETIAGDIGGTTATLNPLPEDYIESMRAAADALALELE